MPNRYRPSVDGTAVVQVTCPADSGNYCYTETQIPPAVQNVLDQALPHGMAKMVGERVDGLNKKQQAALDKSRKEYDARVRKFQKKMTSAWNAINKEIAAELGEGHRLRLIDVEGRLHWAVAVEQDGVAHKAMVKASISVFGQSASKYL